MAHCCSNINRLWSRSDILLLNSSLTLIVLCSFRLGCLLPLLLWTVVILRLSVHDAKALRVTWSTLGRQALR